MIHQAQTLSLSLLLVGAALAAGPGEPSPTTLATETIAAEPTWTPLDMPLPWPYQSPSINIPPANPNTAILGMLYSNPCGGHTDFESTTTVNLPVNCHGARALSVSLRVGRCPLGRAGPPGTVDTVTATPATSFAYTCLPTPNPPPPSSTINLADVTRTLALPTLSAGETPPMTATALQVVHHAGGECRVDLGLAPTGGLERGEWTSAECAKQRVFPQTWVSTVTKIVQVGCDGCEYIRGGVVTASCAKGYYTTLEQSWSETRTVSGEATTRWAYECLPRR